MRLSLDLRHNLVESVAPMDAIQQTVAVARQVAHGGAAEKLLGRRLGRERATGSDVGAVRETGTHYRTGEFLISFGAEETAGAGARFVGRFLRFFFAGATTLRHSLVAGFLMIVRPETRQRRFSRVGVGVGIMVVKRRPAFPFPHVHNTITTRIFTGHPADHAAQLVGVGFPAAAQLAAIGIFSRYVIG